MAVGSKKYCAQPINVFAAIIGFKYLMENRCGGFKRSMLAQVLTISRFTFIESLRNRLLLLCFLIVGVSFAMVEFIGELTLTEHRVTQVAILAAFLRLSAVAIVTLFVVSSTIRELHDKTLEMILAMPIRRGSYYLGKLVGYFYIAALVSVIFAALLLLYVRIYERIYLR